MPSPDSLADGVRAGQRAAVSRAITLSSRAAPSTGRRPASCSRRSRLRPSRPSGSASRACPGVGKSTFIETLGRQLTAAGHRVGVLAVDPSSQRTGGSVLGDKIRMPTLSIDPDAYIRASPSAGTLGGVARATSQAILVLEAAAYDVVLVETVGVGQSETTVAGMVDTFLFLTLARTGDQLQGIKRGILELADVIAVNKADGDRLTEAKVAARELAGALRMVHGRDGAPAVVTCSGLTGDGVDERVGEGARPPRPPRRRRARREAGPPAARLRLGAGPRRARAAAPPLRAGTPGARRGARAGARAASSPRWPPPTASSRRTTARRMRGPANR